MHNGAQYVVHFCVIQLNMLHWYVIVDTRNEELFRGLEPLEVFLKRFTYLLTWL